MRKDRWLKDRVIFWQTIFEQTYEGLKGRGIKLKRTSRSEDFPRKDETGPAD